MPNNLHTIGYQDGIVCIKARPIDEVHPDGISFEHEWDAINHCEFLGSLWFRFGYFDVAWEQFCFIDAHSPQLIPDCMETYQMHYRNWLHNEIGIRRDRYVDEGMVDFTSEWFVEHANLINLFRLSLLKISRQQYLMFSEAEGNALILAARFNLSRSEAKSYLKKYQTKLHR
ncbi:hypothetical protein BCS93_03640 [Vibrio breoganii]|uniref:Uncharacterized protein n=1 Tax=Vibrio breoganii TaxID=553239 RepID=A0AAP8MUE1_9VIBR|nr:hypothetical protein [Vibrio breoganii]PMP07299.1 hypothetical protein BCS93_03640 [Vibrio breoganii]